MEQLGQLALVLTVFLGIVVAAWRRGREDPAERLWIPIAVAIAPMAVAWVLTKDDQRALEAAFLVWVIAIYVVIWCVVVWWEYPRAGAYITEFREAIGISVAAALFALSWFWWAGSEAQGLAIPIFGLTSSLGWVRYQYAKRGGWW